MGADSVLKKLGKGSYKVTIKLYAYNRDDKGNTVTDTVPTFELIIKDGNVESYTTAQFTSQSYYPNGWHRFLLSISSITVEEI